MSTSETAAGSGAFEVTVARTLGEVEAIRPSWTRLQTAENRPNCNADIDRYISVVESLDGRERPVAVLVTEGDTPLALAAARIGKRPFRAGVGYKTLLAPELECLSVIHGGLLGSPDGAVLERLWRELYAFVEQREVDTVFFNHFPVDSPIVALANRTAGLLQRGYFARREPHWSMTMPESMDAFLASLSSANRQDLRRALRKVRRKYGDSVEHVSYPEDMNFDAAMTAVEEISKNAYQRALGAGFTGKRCEIEQLAAAARLGWLRVHILLLEGKPASFELAIEYSRTLFLVATAYDPKFRAVNPGKALFLMLLEDLCERGGIDRIDFGFGDADYKRVYCDTRVEETASFVFARRPRPMMVNLMQGASAAVTVGLKKVLAKTGGKRRVKRRWRDRITHGETQGGR